MKEKKPEQKRRKGLRQEVLRSMLASFKIEGIHISEEHALAVLKKIELNLGKQNG